MSDPKKTTKPSDEAVQAAHALWGNCSEFSELAQAFDAFAAKATDQDIRNRGAK